ncbi:hypothetical protein ACHAXT_009834 [Thalassiosira profunda]
MSSNRTPPSSPPRSRHSSTHGRDSVPQSHHRDTLGSSADPDHHLEYDGLLREHTRGNCCTWKVATLFLALVAAALVVTWIVLPAEEIVAQYIPTFEAPESPYTGPEAGGSSPGGGGTANEGDVFWMPPSQTPADDETDVPGTTVPSFMQCPQNGQPCCNGSPANCKLRVNEMLFALSHNAMSTEEGGFIVGYNHFYDLEKSLVAGYRGLSLDVCNCNGALQFCHNVCDLGERVPNEVFTNTLQFLNENPSEVIVLLFEASQEKGPIVWNDLYAEMEGVDGFSDMLYVHTYGDEWPLMSDLVQQNKRIITFYFNGGTCTDDSCPPPFNYFYTYAAETQFQSASLSDLENSEYSCEITRGPGEEARPADFFVVNNFVTPPDAEAAKVANGNAFLTKRLTACANANKKRPNFVYLDFWSEGNSAQVVQYANNQYAQKLGR